MDDAATVWVRSSYSDSQGGQCVEWAPALASAGVVPVRDSKAAERGPVVFSVGAWTTFVRAVRGGGGRPV